MAVVIGDQASCPLRDRRLGECLGDSRTLYAVITSNSFLWSYNNVSFDLLSTCACLLPYHGLHLRHPGIVACSNWQRHAAGKYSGRAFRSACRRFWNQTLRKGSALSVSIHVSCVRPSYLDLLFVHGDAVRNVEVGFFVGR